MVYSWALWGCLLCHLSPVGVCESIFLSPQSSTGQAQGHHSHDLHLCQSTQSWAQSWAPCCLSVLPQVTERSQVTKRSLEMKRSQKPDRTLSIPPPPQPCGQWGQTAYLLCSQHPHCWEELGGMWCGKGWCIFREAVGFVTGRVHARWPTNFRSNLEPMTSDSSALGSFTVTC